MSADDHAYPCCDDAERITSKDRSVTPVQPGMFWMCERCERNGWHPVGPYHHDWEAGEGYRTHHGDDR